jgi:homoserine/homoserine lactone efflux protein
MSIETWLTFVAVFTLLSLPVGPNAVQTMATAVAVGLPKGFLVPLGMGIASIIHVLFASLGLGALLLASAEAFTVFKWLGVAYLVWLGLRLWRSNSDDAPKQRNRGRSTAGLIASGCLVSLSNPKAVLSYLAVLPPFISASAPLAPQLAVIMPTATGIVLLVYSAWALLAVPLRKWANSPRRLGIFNRSAAASYFIAAGAFAMAGKK